MRTIDDEEECGVEELYGLPPYDPDAEEQVAVPTCEVVSPQYFDLLPLLGGVAAASLQLEPSTKERKIDEALEKLKQGVESIQGSENFRQFLITMSKFHNYSIGNRDPHYDPEAECDPGCRL